MQFSPNNYEKTVKLKRFHNYNQNYEVRKIFDF